LRNFGDLPARFKWEVNPKKDYSKFFTFSPSSGVIPPHEDQPLDIIFHPQKADNNISFEKIKCHVENFEPLFITLYGKSVDVPNESITQSKITTEVRVQTKYEIKLKNPTDKVWRITPSISTSEEQFLSYFKGDHIFEIKPGVEGIYEVFYLPLTMSKPPNTLVEKEHESTIFFPLPDGSAKVHKLIGIANPPKAIKTLTETFKAREWKVFELDINNWLYQTQRFKVSWVIDNKDPSIFIKGADTIDISSNSTKKYKLSFRSWKELQCSLTITFENAETKEFVFYVININVSAADPNLVTELAGVTREIITSTITITNPLKLPVQIQPNQIVCDPIDIVSIKPNSFNIIPESEMPIEVSFRPLTVSQQLANIIIKSVELGDLKYPLLLKGSSNPAPKAIPTIKTYLGSEKMVSISFTNYLKKQSTYSVKVEKFLDSYPLPIDFITDVNLIQADPTKGSELSFSVKFEPYFIGESKAIVKVSSPEGGEYSWVLAGEARPPQAQGPYKIPVSKPYTLEFKNPLNEPADVVARFDNPNFFLAGKLDARVNAKAPIKVQISFKPGQDQVNTGRLIINLNKLPPMVFYLQTE
jgi:hydrocephalus-inducing protein